MKRDPTAHRNIIIGTAGHIDHGKTVLVKALTGRDTDRLAEEKERGISIDLGFAPLELSDGSVAGIVDVPGHENFVRNMLAGATGVDLALLVVAADDGVMPQTREHLAILDLLGVTRGVVAITKSDLVDPEMIDLVSDEISDLLEHTELAGSPVIPVSGVTGQGIDDLRSEIERQAAAIEVKDESLPPRLPIDRVFTLKGIGTVVTGTLWSGSINDSDQLELLPAGRAARVRSLQVHDSERQTVHAGERVAVNIAGISKDEVTRGDVLTVPGYLQPTYMLDARVNLLSDWVRPLKRGTRLRFHHGTREVMGRVYPLEAGSINPGEEAPAQLRLEGTAVCAPGDRFVLRSYSPMTTIGGGTVVDVHPRKHKVHDPGAVGQFAELESGDTARSVAVYLSRAGKPTNAGGLTLASSLPPAVVRDGLRRLEEDGQALSLGEDKEPAYVDAALYREAVEGVKTALAELHKAKPLAGGMAKETLKKKALGSWDSRAADILIEKMVAGSIVQSDGKVVALPGAEAAVTGEEQGLLDEIVFTIEEHPVSPPTLSELAAELGRDKGTLAELLAMAEKRKQVVRVSPELFFAPAAVSEIEKKLKESITPEGMTVSDFKNLIGTSRKYALPLLEYFDRMRVTVRAGDLRKLR
jgi:selenocysteine-specific elongation factor